MSKKYSGGTCRGRWRMSCLACRRRYTAALKTGVPSEDRPPSGRYTLNRPPPFIESMNSYKTMRKCKCPHCGSDEVVSVEHQRRKEKMNQDICRCAMIPFPHQKGTVFGCQHHPDFERDWTPDEEEKYDGLINTPRYENG